MRRLQEGWRRVPRSLKQRFTSGKREERTIMTEEKRERRMMKGRNPDECRRKE